jgi:hypothetical protein
MIFLIYDVYRESEGRLNTVAWFVEMLDLIAAGATSMTSMLNGLHSIQRTSLMLCSAALEAQ